MRIAAHITLNTILTFLSDYFNKIEGVFLDVYIFLFNNFLYKKLFLLEI